MRIRFGLGMAAALVMGLFAGPVLATNCGYPARSALSLDKFEQYGGAAVQKVGLTYDASLLRGAIAEDMTQVADYRASFTPDERKAFFDRAEAGIARRVVLIRQLADDARKAGVSDDATAWLTNHVDALQTCGESAQRTENGSHLAALVAQAAAYKDDAIIDTILGGLPQACNDTLLDTVADPMTIPEPGTPAAYAQCAVMLEKTASRASPDHFTVHHRLADPACELATRLKALMQGARPVAIQRTTQL